MRLWTAWKITVPIKEDSFIILQHFPAVKTLGLTRPRPSYYNSRKGGGFTSYTVGEMAQQAGIPASTLRYYDKEGLPPFVERTPGGIRIFQDRDMEWLRVIGCLKRAGMPLEDIRRYIQLAMEGDGTIGERLELFRKQRELLRARMAELQATLDVLEYKCWYYETAQAAGTVEVPQSLAPEQVPEPLRATRRKLRDVPGK